MTRRVVTVETDYQQVREVRTVYAQAEANKLLSGGKWTLLHGGVSHRDTTGYQAVPTFIMGRIKN